MKVRASILALFFFAVMVGCAGKAVAQPSGTGWSSCAIVDSMCSQPAPPSGAMWEVVTRYSQFSWNGSGYVLEVLYSPSNFSTTEFGYWVSPEVYDPGTDQWQADTQAAGWYRLIYTSTEPPGPGASAPPSSGFGSSEVGGTLVIVGSVLALGLGVIAGKL